MERGDATGYFRKISAAHADPRAAAVSPVRLARIPTDVRERRSTAAIQSRWCCGAAN